MQGITKIEKPSNVLNPFLISPNDHNTITTDNT